MKIKITKNGILYEKEMERSFICGVRLGDTNLLQLFDGTDFKRTEINISLGDGYFEFAESAEKRKSGVSMSGSSVLTVSFMDSPSLEKAYRIFDRFTNLKIVEAETKDIKVEIEW